MINHQGPFPAVTINYSLKPGASLDATFQGIEQALAELHMPVFSCSEPAGDIKAFAEQELHARPAHSVGADRDLYRARRSLIVLLIR